MKNSTVERIVKESFKSLEKKLEKGGKSKLAADKIAGSIANKKLHGAGSGPTAKQKARMSEELSADNFERMSGLVFTRDIQNMIKAAESMMNELTAEGFEPEEIREFFTKLIANDI